MKTMTIRKIVKLFGQSGPVSVKPGMGCLFSQLSTLAFFVLEPKEVWKEHITPPQMPEMF